MTSSNILTRFTRNLLLTAVLLIPVTLLFVAYVRAEKGIDSAFRLRHTSLQLANELRLSSEDLTRLVRTYVVTGEPRYKRLYQDVLDIRDGRKARPAGYWRRYWELALGNDAVPHPDVPHTIPLIELMRRNGFSDEELARLGDAKVQSDRLAILEQEAMRLSEAVGPGAAALKARAVQMVFGEPYHRAKAAIMRPIDEVHLSLERRTERAIHNAELHATLLRCAFIIFALWLLFMLWRTRSALRSTLGGSVEELYGHIARIGKGDFSSAIPVPPGQSASVLGWLGETQSRLSEIDRERREAEAALRLTQASVDAATDEIYWITPDARIVEVNPAVCRSLGYTREELLRMSIPDLDPHYDATVWSRHFAELREGGFMKFETEHRAKDGRLMPVEIVATYVRYGDEERNCAIARDLTERRQMEQALKISEERHLFISENVTDNIWSLGLDLKITYMSPSIEKTVGFTRDEFVQIPLEEMFTPPSFAPARQYIARMADCVRTGLRLEDFRGELEMYRKDGSTVWVEILASPLLDSAGHITGLAGVTRDISDRKKSERELEKAREAANAANKAKSEFLSNMSHEIRTPMNGIIGMAQLLQYTELTVEQQEYLDAINSSSNNLLRLINDILDLSKIEAGKIELEEHEFSLRATVTDVVNTQVSVAYRKNLGIRIDIPSNVPDSLRGDQLRLKQIILNFLSNAVKFTETGGITVSAAVTEQIGTIATLRIGVTDSGIGISPEAMGKIFEPFSQADSSTTRKYGGTGLGLTICKQLAELMGGSIGVDSEAGVGSTFSVQIPFVVTSVLPVPNDLQKGVASSLTWDGPPLRVLVADDEEINVRIAARVLTRTGATVVTAGNGREAVAAWECGRFDLILMDIKMPVLDGIGATEEIRRKERETGGRTPVIALTANALREEKEQILRQGFDGYVTKPVEFTVLFAEMKRCLAATSPP